MPAHLTFAEAATLPSSAITAWTATGGGTLLRTGETVVVQGTGGVSAFAIQFAVAQGARVIVTSSDDAKIPRMKMLGAMESINYRRDPEWSQNVLALTQGRGADWVIDVGGKSTVDESMKSVAYGGTVALVGGLGGYDASLSTFALIGRGITARGVMAGSRVDFVKMCEFMHAHDIHPLVYQTYAFDDFKAAMSQLKSGDFVGKIVLTL
jgi:NADPH:quinone reductase-like Zn-dependent oxidoreductase